MTSLHQKTTPGLAAFPEATSSTTCSAGLKTTPAHVVPESTPAIDAEEEIIRSERALGRLAPRIQLINRIYVKNVRERKLYPATEAKHWIGRDVYVFLRHDHERVFAVVCEKAVGMADYVALTDVTFVVNERGRRQSIAGQGPLPNGHTIHAYLSGRLTGIADSGTAPDMKTQQPVVYWPEQRGEFLALESLTPIQSSPQVVLAPGKLKVWVPRSHGPESAIAIKQEPPL